MFIIYIYIYFGLVDQVKIFSMIYILFSDKHRLTICIHILCVGISIYIYILIWYPVVNNQTPYFIMTFRSSQNQ